MSLGVNAVFTVADMLWSDVDTVSNKTKPGEFFSDVTFLGVFVCNKQIYGTKFK